MKSLKLRLIDKGKIFGYERLNQNQWEWMCLALNPDNGERWVSGVMSGEFLRDMATGITMDGRIMLKMLSATLPSPPTAPFSPQPVWGMKGL